MNSISSLSICFFITCAISKVSSFPGNRGRFCRKSNGRCVPFSNCITAINAVRKYRKHNLIRCGFEGMEEIVCCPDIPFTSDYEQYNDIEYPNIWNILKLKSISKNPSLPRKSEIACDEYSNEIPLKATWQIAFGKNSKIGEFPHMAAIGYSKNDGQIYYDCGGSLIHKKYVLTAAHCVVNLEKKLEHVRFGKIDLIGNYNSLIEQGYKIKKITVHDLYDPRMQINDIALIHLEDEVESTDTVRPACLYSKRDNPKRVIASGFGSVNRNKNKNNILQKVVMDVVSNQYCNNIYARRYYKEITSKQICASSNVHGDTCLGDSGGPLQIVLPSDGNVMYSIVGVTAYGPVCGSNVPGVYTSVNQYIDWIEEKVWPN